MMCASVYGALGGCSETLGNGERAALDALRGDLAGLSLALADEDFVLATQHGDRLVRIFLCWETGRREWCE